MNSDAYEGRTRLDSWKAIAAHLNRDERTVQRWERELGLPVHRVPGGRGRSVFAFADEIDGWLHAQAGPDAGGQGGGAPRRSWASASLWSAVAVVVALVVAALVWRLRPAAAAEPQLHVAVTTDGVTAFDPSGTRRWTYAFPASYLTQLAEAMSDPAYVTTDGTPSIYVGTAFRIRHADGAQESGAIEELDRLGTPRRSFSFADEVTFAGTTYGPPWVITDFAVYDAGGARRIAVAAHHHLWSASLVTVLDEQFHRHGTFVHAGWIEQVRWLASNRLVIGGYSNAHDGGMVALLDPTARDGVDGQGPEPPGSRYHCDSCPSAPPLRMAVLPRTELNVATASRFNRARIDVTPRGILTRTIEATPPGQDAVEALYEFTPALDVVRASFGDHYWELHRALELTGALRSSRERSAEKDGPRAILTWAPDRGWTTLKLR